MNAVFMALRDGDAVERALRTVRQAGYEVELAATNRWRVGDATDHLWLFEETNPSEVPNELRSLLRDPDARYQSIVVLEYYSLPLVKRLIEVLATDPETIVDNDHGTTQPGPEFVTRLRSNKAWDWRSDSGSESTTL